MCKGRRSHMNRCATITAANEHVLRVGFTLPSLVMTVYQEDEILDFSSVVAATFKARRRGRPSSPLKIDRAALVLSPPTDGRVRVDFVDADVDVAATYDWWLEVEFSDGKLLPVPNPGYGTLTVLPV